MERRSWAEKFADEVRRLPALILLLLLSAIIAASGTIFGAAFFAWEAYDDHFRWRDHEYDKISELRAGITVERFKEILGSPLFVRENVDGSLTESSFKGRDYWVQAVHDPTGTVQMYSVTACDVEFTPTFEVSAITGGFWQVTLNRGYLDDVPETPTRMQYIWSVATTNQNFWDEYYLGNPGFYKTYYVGINDACPTASLGVDALFRNELFLSYEPVEYFEHHGVREFRSTSIPNMYGEVAPFVSEGLPGIYDGDGNLSGFQVGVDRILTRTVR